MTSETAGVLTALFLYCAHCGQPVDLTWRMGAHKQPISWSCPHANCQRSQVVELAGTIVQVSPGRDRTAAANDNPANEVIQREPETLEL